MCIAGASQKIRIMAALLLSAAVLAPGRAAAFEAPAVPEDPVAQSTLPLQFRARERAIEAFHDGTDSKKKSRYKWAGRPAIVLKYEQPVNLWQRDMIFEVKVPGRKGTWARFRLKF